MVALQPPAQLQQWWVVPKIMMILLLVALSSCGGGFLVQASSSSSFSSMMRTRTPPWRRRRQWGGELLSHRKNNVRSFLFATSTPRISSSSNDNVDENDEAALLLGLPSQSVVSGVDQDKVTNKETTTTTRRSPPRMLAGIFGRFGGAVPAASSASVGIAVVLLLGGWKLSQWIRANQLEEQQRVPSKNDTTTSLSRYIAMCQDQLPHVWKHEILSKILELHNEEDKEEDENGRGDEEQIIIHQVLLENPALVRTLRRRVQPFMRQRMRLLKQAQAILDQHVQSNHNKSTKTTRSIISLEDWKIWAAYHAEITVEKYRLATQTLSERLERTTDSTVSRSQLVQGLTHRLTMYCHAMNGGGGGSSDSVDDSAQGLVVLDDHVLRTFFKEALKDAILPLPQPNNDDDGEDVLHNTTMKPAATVAHLLQVVWNRTRHWIGHPILGVMTRSVQKKKREG